MKQSAEFWQHFIKLYEQQRLPHALLLTGVDAENFAKQMARHVLATDDKGAALFDSADGHPDLLSLQPEGKAELIKIDAIRSVSEFLTQTAQQGGYRVVIIPVADRMNVAASNALLKSLEEPGANTLMILLTQLPHLLLPTIRSRCQRWNLVGEAVQPESPEQTDFTLALLNREDPLALAAKYSSLPLTQTIDWLVMAAQQPLRANPNSQAFAYIDRCYQAKAMVNRHINLNPQLLLEDLLIEWRRVKF